MAEAVEAPIKVTRGLTLSRKRSRNTLGFHHGSLEHDQGRPRARIREIKVRIPETAIFSAYWRVVNRQVPNPGSIGSDSR